MSVNDHIIFTFKSNLTGDQQFLIVFQSEVTNEEIRKMILERMRTVPLNKFNILPPFSLSDGLKLEVRSIDFVEDWVELEWTRPFKRTKFSDSDRKTVKPIAPNKSFASPPMIGHTVGELDGKHILNNHKVIWTNLK